MNSCHECIDLMHEFIKICPKLKRLHEYGEWHFTSCVRDYWRRQALLKSVDETCEALKLNYHLVEFKSKSIHSEIEKLLKASLQSPERVQFSSYKKTVESMLSRNQAGLLKCRAAIYQLFLMKRYRLESVFRFIGIDVVRLIARLVYATSDSCPKIWC